MTFDELRRSIKDPPSRPLIDFDRSQMRIPATGWRSRNLARLERSLLKLRGTRSEAAVREDFKRLRAGYDKHWERGI